MEFKSIRTHNGGSKMDLKSILYWKWSKRVEMLLEFQRLSVHQSNYVPLKFDSVGVKNVMIHACFYYIRILLSQSQNLV